MNKHLVACHKGKLATCIHVHVCHKAKVGRESRRQRETGCSYCTCECVWFHTFLYCTVYNTVPDAHLTESEQLPEVVVRGDQSAQYHWLLELLHSMHLIRKLHRGEEGGYGERGRGRGSDVNW